MAEITIKFNLPDGQEAALIREFAEFHGWTEGNGTPAAYAKNILAETIRNSIKSSREIKAFDEARLSVTEVEVI